MLIKQVELNRKKEFIAITLNPQDKAFIVHITSTNRDLDAYISRRPLITSVKADKTHIPGPFEYIEFADIFFKDLTAELLEYIRANDYAIEHNESLFLCSII